VLEVDLDKADPGVALDHDAVLDHAWKYAVERVLKVEINQHALEIAGRHRRRRRSTRRMCSTGGSGGSGGGGGCAGAGD